MATGREFTAQQRKIINRYYDHIDTIVITRLSEISTDMALAQGDAKKLDRLWKRAEQALAKATPSEQQASPEITKVLASRDVEAFARLVSKLCR